MTETPPPYDTPRKRGRPPKADAKQSYTTRLAPDVVDFLRQLDNQVEWLEGRIKRSADFRAWLQSQRRQA